MKKKIMILGAGLYQVPLIETARRLGLYTVVVSIPGAYRGFEIADRVYKIDTRDQESILKAATDENIYGICTTGTDVAVRSIGYVCERMNLPGISLRASDILCDKAKMKEAFLKGGVSCAKGKKAFHFHEALQVAEELGYPVVVKRVDSSGSRGITVVNEKSQMREAYLHAREKTMRDYVLIEQFLRGIEIGVDGYVKNGRVCFIAPHGKFTFRSEQTTVPIGHFFPFQGASGLLQDIRTQIQLAVDASGLDNSCFNADVFVDGNHSYIIEMGGRCGATCIPELISSFYGFDYYQQILRGALGEETRFPEQAEHATPCMAKLLISPQSGILTEVDNAKLDHLRSQGIRIQIDYPVGWRVHAITDGTDRIGSVIADTQDEAVFNHILQEVQECIRINGVSLGKLWNA